MQYIGIRPSTTRWKKINDIEKYNNLYDQKRITR